MQHGRVAGRPHTCLVPAQSLQLLLVSANTGSKAGAASAKSGSTSLDGSSRHNITSRAAHLQDATVAAPPSLPPPGASAHTAGDPGGGRRRAGNTDQSRRPQQQSEQQNAESDPALESMLQLQRHLSQYSHTLTPRQLKGCLNGFISTLTRLPPKDAPGDIVSNTRRQKCKEAATAVAALLCRALVRDCSCMKADQLLSVLRMLTLMRSQSWLPVSAPRNPLTRPTSPVAHHSDSSPAPPWMSDNPTTAPTTTAAPTEHQQLQSGWRSELAAACSDLVARLVQRMVQLMSGGGGVTVQDTAWLLGALAKLEVGLTDGHLDAVQDHLMARLQQIHSNSHPAAYSIHRGIAHAADTGNSQGRANDSCSDVAHLVHAAADLAKLGGPSCLRPQLLDQLTAMVLLGVDMQPPGSAQPSASAPRIDLRTCVQLVWLTAQWHTRNQQQLTPHLSLTAQRWLQGLNSLSGRLSHPRCTLWLPSPPAPPSISTSDSTPQLFGTESWAYALTHITRSVLQHTYSRRTPVPPTTLATLVACWLSADLPCPQTLQSQLLQWTLPLITGSSQRHKQGSRPQPRAQSQLPLQALLQLSHVPHIVLTANTGGPGSDLMDPVKQRALVSQQLQQWSSSYLQLVLACAVELEPVQLHWLVNQLVAAACVSASDLQQPPSAAMQLLLSDLPWSLSDCITVARALPPIPNPHLRTASGQGRDRQLHSEEHGTGQEPPLQLPPEVLVLVRQLLQYHSAVAALWLAETGAPHKRLLGHEYSKLRAVMEAGWQLHAGRAQAVPSSSNSSNSRQTGATAHSAVARSQGLNADEANAAVQAWFWFEPGSDTEAAAYGQDDALSLLSGVPRPAMSAAKAAKAAERQARLAAAQASVSAALAQRVGLPTAHDAAQFVQLLQALAEVLQGRSLLHLGVGGDGGLRDMSEQHMAKAGALGGAVAVAAVRSAQRGPSFMPTPLLCETLEVLRRLFVVPKSAKWRGLLQLNIARRIAVGELRHAGPQASTADAAVSAPAVRVLQPVLALLRALEGLRLNAGYKIDVTFSRELLAWHLAPGTGAAQLPATTQHSARQGQGEQVAASTAGLDDAVQPWRHSVAVAHGWVLDKDVVQLMQLMRSVRIPGSDALLDRLHALVGELTHSRQLRGKYTAPAILGLCKLGRPPDPQVLAGMVTVAFGLQEGAPQVQRGTGPLDMSNARAVLAALRYVQYPVLTPQRKALVRVYKVVRGLFEEEEGETPAAQGGQWVGGEVVRNAEGGQEEQRLVIRYMRGRAHAEQLATTVRAALGQLAATQESWTVAARNAGTVEEPAGESEHASAADAWDVESEVGDSDLGDSWDSAGDEDAGEPDSVSGGSDVYDDWIASTLARLRAAEEQKQSRKSKAGQKSRNRQT